MSGAEGALLIVLCFSYTRCYPSLSTILFAGPDPYLLEVDLFICLVHQTGRRPCIQWNHSCTPLLALMPRLLCSSQQSMPPEDQSPSWPDTAGESSSRCLMRRQSVVGNLEANTGMHCSRTIYVTCAPRR
ncbi:uncharacterized protein B0H18DRAFT_318084 [Fomitopsis serialis]|uniref:uncharacterized protein n=1 Tax=Fomitopsis serialis TaxID=139415 RepID=UPI002008BB7E|nr:uncharacterized protein B0H18DRAFT_318084 [Neoantrodia serialis]KAH9936247.1 hypothetical protein B0H18DRAFT_318084 [Neoantrodia serialis]